MFTKWSGFFTFSVFLGKSLDVKTLCVDMLTFGLLTKYQASSGEAGVNFLTNTLEQKRHDRE